MTRLIIFTYFWPLLNLCPSFVAMESEQVFAYIPEESIENITGNYIMPKNIKKNSQYYVQGDT